jgi:mono/diheme cytochrome c family protein
VLGLLPVLVIYAGLYNVAATYPDPKPVRWVFNTTMEHSVKRRAAGIAVPAGLDETAMIIPGLEHYRDDCQACHGAPGVRPGELAAGLNPHPPLLARSVDEWQPNELFWITKYGIRMTGMPSWAHDLSDEETWQITAFLLQLPTMTAEQYQAMAPEEE